MQTKVKTIEELRPLLALLRATGKKIVFTNGCFDLIHTGHTRYLSLARSFGDLLVVAVNSDASVRGIKGDKRPINAQTERAETLAALGSVDFVTIFDEPNVERILRTLRPDVHAKGSDYTKETVPERETVLACGGRIAISGGPKIRSASEVIPRVVARMKAVR